MAVARVAIFAAYVAVVISPVVVATVVGGSSGQSFVYELGKAVALSALVILGLQFVLAGRIRTIARSYGLDMLLRFHGWMGVVAFVLLVAHPLLLSAGLGDWSLILSTDAPWYIWLGKIGLFILIIQVGTTILRQRLLSFERWRLVHNLALVILVLGLAHSWFTGSDLQSGPLRWMWVGLGALALGVYVHHKAVRPLLAKRDLWQVAEVKQETHDVHSVVFRPPSGHEIGRYQPGQFHFVSLYRGDAYDGEEHPFTISSSPTEKRHLSSTIKHSGDFTATIGQTQPGDKALIQGPYGAFTYVRHPQERQLVFVAGGIGITPLRSMLRHMADTEANIDVVLLYGNRTRGDIVFKDELEQIAGGERPHLKIVHVLSEPDETWDGERGYVDREIITRHCGERLSDRVFYVCGPPPMMALVTRTLRGLGVPAANIRSERFAL